ncbi:MFS transporter [Cystobacter fuscus]
MKTALKSPMKLGLLTSLYFSQGLPFGFFTQALPVLLRKQGLSLPAIGLANLLALPWALKFLWAPVMDRYGSERLGRRRGYILPLQFLSAALLLGLALPEGSASVPTLLVAMLLVNLLAATQDVATDGLAVDLLEPEELGWGNGIQVAGYRVGMIVGGGLMLLIFDALGWRPTLVCLGVLLLVATVPVALFREPPARAPRSAEGSLGRWLREALLYWVRRPGAGTWFLLLVLFKAGESRRRACCAPSWSTRGWACRRWAGCSGSWASPPGCSARSWEGRSSTGWGSGARCSSSAPSRPARCCSTPWPRAGARASRCSRWCVAWSTSPAAWPPRRSSRG